MKPPAVPPIARRTLIGAAVALPALVRPTAAVAAPADDPPPAWPPAEHFPLWPGGAPGMPARPPVPELRRTVRPGGYRDLETRGTMAPLIGVYRPRVPDGRAVLVIPGGGYSFAAIRNEGIDVAQRLAASGITAFVLSYRLPGDGWRDRADTPLADAQRAMRLIRAFAPRWRINPARASVIGFSAGGHLAGSLAAHAELRVYAPVDAADRQAARPAATAMIYAVSNVDPGRSHGGSRAQLLGPNPDPRLQERYAIERRLAGAPPLFLVHCEDDAIVPVVNSLDMLAAARRAGVAAEAHIFRRGGHGFGTRLPAATPASLWPELYVRWLGEALPG